MTFTPSAASSTPPATGTQFHLHAGDATAIVTSLAAGLRQYVKQGVDLVASYPADSIAPRGAGITLAPFANRIEDGLWQLDGEPQQLDITEVPLHNAIHGLLRNTGYHAVDSSDAHVELEAVIHPQHGYPFLLRHRVRYELDAGGKLRVSQTLINDSTRSAPAVLGAHPYLTLGAEDPATLTLQVHAEQYLLANERMIPTGRAPVSGKFDLRTAKVVADSFMDVTFTDLQTDDGVAWHTLEAPDGRRVGLWHDESVRYLHVYVTDLFPGRSVAVAMEPMTGPANAFNSGESVQWLAPGESFTMNWGIDATGL